MAILNLTLPKPVNISLQAKPSTVVDGYVTQGGAWDIIYFVRMNQGSVTGQIYRLGKVINIITEGSVLGEELVQDSSFSSEGNLVVNTTGDYWTTQNKWIIESSTSSTFPFTTNYYAYVSADDSNTSTLSQSTSNANVSSYQGGEYIKTGNTYQVSFDVLAVGTHGGGSTIKVGGYTQPASDIFNQTTNLDTKTVTYKATSDGLSFIASENSEGWKIDNISVKRVFTADDSNYIVSVLVDSTAQTPDVNDFIFFGKDNQIGTAGVTGYYATVEMKNDSIDYAELFAVSSEVTESSK